MAGNSNSGQHLKGEKYPGSGRKPGTRNVKAILLEDVLGSDELRRKIDEGIFQSPLSLWVEILNDPITYDLPIRMEAAKQCAPYIHRKQAQVVEQNITADSSVNGFTISMIPKKEE